MSDNPLAIIDDNTDAAEIEVFETGHRGIVQANLTVDAAVEATTGMALRDANNDPVLFYRYKAGGKIVRGGSVKLMRALASARGEFAVMHQPDIDQDATKKIVEVNGQDETGRPIVKEILLPAVRATMWVTDLLTNYTTVGDWTEPYVEKRSEKSGGGWYAGTDPQQNAISKAWRNAMAYHFQAVLPVLVAILEGEYDAGAATFSGRIPEQYTQYTGAEAARKVMEDAREARGAMTIGPVREKTFLERYRAAQEGMSDNDRSLMNSDFATRIKSLLVDGKIGTSPETLLPTLEAWIRDFEPDDTDAPAEAPEPAPEAQSAKIEAPTPEIIRETLRAIETHSPGATAEIYLKCGVGENQDIDPDVARALWETLQPYLEEATR